MKKEGWGRGYKKMKRIFHHLDPYKKVKMWENRTNCAGTVLLWGWFTEDSVRKQKNRLFIEAHKHRGTTTHKGKLWIYHTYMYHTLLVKWELVILDEWEIMHTAILEQSRSCWEIRPLHNQKQMNDCKKSGTLTHILMISLISYIISYGQLSLLNTQHQLIMFTYKWLIVSYASIQTL